MIHSSIHAIIIIFLLTGIGLAAILIVPGDYQSIQSAIDGSSPRDTIKVHSGVYDEHITVTKQLTLNGLGNERGMPVISSTVSGSLITLSADGVTIEGFSIIGGGGSCDATGILVASNSANLRNNTITNCFDSAIKIVNSEDNIIRGNNISYNYIGIDLVNSSSEILENDITHNRYGIVYDIFSTLQSTILNNKFIDNISDMKLRGLGEPP